MKRLLLTFLVTISFWPLCSAQNWAPIGNFNRSPSIVWNDTVNDRLLVAGSYTYVDSNFIAGFGYLDGDSIVELGCGFDAYCGDSFVYYQAISPVNDFEWYKGELYVAGTFIRAGGVHSPGIAKWGGSDWIPIGRGLTFGGMGSTGEGFRLEVMNDELYLYGVFDSIDGIPAHSIAKFDGTTWSDVFNFPKNGQSVPLIFDAEWYNGELYVGGNFSINNNTPVLSDILKYDGTNWVNVDSSFISTYSVVSYLETYKGRLILGGRFNPGDDGGNIPGYNIAAWDGASWDTLLGGLQGYPTPSLSGGINRGMIYNNELYVCGKFDQAGGTPARNIAKFDGTQWCGQYDLFQTDITSFAFYHDTLYVTLRAGTINNDSSLMHAVKWIRGTVGLCQWPIGVENPTPHEDQVTLFPNPAGSRVSIQFPAEWQECKISLYDPAGRRVRGVQKIDANSQELDISGLAAGLYLVRIQHAETQVTRKLVVE